MNCKSTQRIDSTAVFEIKCCGAAICLETNQINSFFKCRSLRQALV